MTVVLGEPGAVLASARLGIARAADAPAPTIVIDGSELPLGTDRLHVLEWMRAHRAGAMVVRPDLGSKTAVVMRPQDDGTLVVHFFQGLPDGRVDPTVTVCVNSAAAALTLAARWWNLSARDRKVVMGTSWYRFQEAS